MNIHERLEKLQLKLKDTVSKAGAIQLQIQQLKLKHYEDKLGVKEGVLVLVHGHGCGGTVAIVDSVDYRKYRRLNDTPWLRVRLKNKNGEFSKRVIRAFDNWEMLVLESKVNK